VRGLHSGFSLLCRLNRTVISWGVDLIIFHFFDVLDRIVSPISLL